MGKAGSPVTPDWYSKMVMYPLAGTLFVVSKGTISSFKKKTKEASTRAYRPGPRPGPSSAFFCGTAFVMTPVQHASKHMNATDLKDMKTNE